MWHNFSTRNSLAFLWITQIPLLSAILFRRTWQISLFVSIKKYMYNSNLYLEVKIILMCSVYWWLRILFQCHEYLTHFSTSQISHWICLFIPKQICQETAARDGLMKMKQVYESNPALGDPMSIQGQLTENGHRLDKLRSELKKFQVHTKLKFRH